MQRLPVTFWTEEVSRYTWGVDAMAAQPIEGSWSEPRARSVLFAEQPHTLKRALKQAYVTRSKYLHAGERGVSFASDLFAEVAEVPAPRLQMAHVRAVLRELILIELRDRSDPDASMSEVAFYLDVPQEPK